MKTNFSNSENFFSPTGSHNSVASAREEINVNDISIDENFYGDPRTPSSTSSVSSTQTFKFQHISMKNKRDTALATPMKARSKVNRFFDYTHNLNRHYAMAMTKLYFRMEKELFKLRQRTHRLERALERERSFSNPIIRIPRLTKDQIFAASQGHAKNITSKSNMDFDPVETMQSSDQAYQTLSTSTIDSVTETDELLIEDAKQKKKFLCSICSKSFCSQHRVDFHVKKYHPNHEIVQAEITNQETEDVNKNLSRQTSDVDTDSGQCPFNAWDLGEGRLRPRPKYDSIDVRTNHKAKCHVCNKLFNAGYIEAHMAKKHKSVLSPTQSDSSETTTRLRDLMAHETNSVQSENSNVIQDQSPSSFEICPTINEDEPIKFSLGNEDDFAGLSDLSSYSVGNFDQELPLMIISTTCLERSQTPTFNDFLNLFSKKIEASPVVNSRTTHLIVNDDLHHGSSPLSLKFLQAIANRCCCISFRWIFECLRFEKLIDHEPFEIHGVANYGPVAGPSRSRLKENTVGPFQGYGLIIKMKNFASTRMSSDDLKSLIRSCNGTIIDTLNKENLSQFKVLVICDQSFLSDHCPEYDALRHIGVRFVKINWILDSILDFRPQNIEPYEETRD